MILGSAGLPTPHTSPGARLGSDAVSGPFFPFRRGACAFGPSVAIGLPGARMMGAAENFNQLG